MKGNRTNWKKEKVWLKVTYSVLESLFSARRRTIQTWIAKGLLDPTDLFDIIKKYNNPKLLDRRKK